jgi:hypothetical protein
MTIQITHGQTIAGSGLSIQPIGIIRSGTGAIGYSVSLPLAQAGTLTTRSDDDTGTITMGSGSHTITTGAVVDVYWSGGVQYGVTVGTVSTTSVPIDSGDGDVLPATSTAVTVVPQTTINTAIDGDNCKILAIMVETTDKSLRQSAHIQLLDVSAAEIAEIDLVTNVAQVWDIEGGSANPFTGNPITSSKASTGGATSGETYTLKIIGVSAA